MKIVLNGVSKSYDGKVVLDSINDEFVSGSPVVIKGESGIGKTTLIRIIEGLETPDKGDVVYEGMPHDKCRFAPVFQETRLIESLNAIDNVKLANRSLSAAKIEEELSLLIPADELHKKVRDLSGGTARRVEIVRAVLAPSDALIMDEPLTGLDDENAARVVSYIKDHIGDRIFIATSHSGLFESFCEVLSL